MWNTPQPTLSVEEESERELLFPSPEEEEEEDRLEAAREVDEEDLIEDPPDLVESAEQVPHEEKGKNGTTRTVPLRKRTRRGITIWTRRSRKRRGENLDSGRVLLDVGEVRREAGVGIEVVEVGRESRVVRRWRARRGLARVLLRVLDGRLRLIRCIAHFVPSCRFVATDIEKFETRLFFLDSPAQKSEFCLAEWL